MLIRLLILLALLVGPCACSPLRSGRDAFVSTIRKAATVSIAAPAFVAGFFRGPGVASAKGAALAPVAFNPLPYAYDALEPFISKKTNEFHHGKHYQTYVKKTLEAVAGTPLEGKDVLAVMRAAKSSGNQGLFNNAAQVFNHEFYWKGMRANAKGLDSRPDEGSAIYRQICKSFVSYENFQKEFSQKSNGHFGSGWCWLVQQRPNGALAIVTTANAETPPLDTATPLLVMDVWEHAYYLDRQNVRASYTDAFIGKLVDWAEVEGRLARA